MHNPLIIGGVISWFVNLLMGFYVLLQNTNKKINRHFFLLNLCIGSWSAGSFLLNVITDKSVAILVLRVSYIFALFLLPAFTNFVDEVLQKPLSKKSKFLTYSFSFFFLFF